MTAPDGNEHPAEEEVPFLFPDTPPSPPPYSENAQPRPRTHFEIATAIEDTKKASAIKRRLYTSHFLSTWNSRVFEFGAVLVLARIYEGTLLAASLYALVRAASAICFAPMIGRYVDRENRLKVVRRSIIGQRTAVLFSCPGFALLAIAGFAGPPITHYMFAIMAALACVEKLCSIMNLIAIERDWVVVIAESSPCELDVLNSQMRRIDLICKLLGPLMIALVDAQSIMFTLYAMFGMNILSLMAEYFTIAEVYRLVSALHSKQETSTSMPDDPRPYLNEPIYRRLPAICLAQIQAIYEGLSDYSHHAAFLPSLTLCLSYLTVLSFSGQMVTYLVSVGMTSDQVGFLRTVSTAVEISATWLAPLAMKNIGPVRSGFWFIDWQIICLFGSVGAFWFVKKPLLAASILVAGMIASRVGLWGLDLCVQIIVQEEVEANSRGSFSSLESSLQNFFELCSYALTIIFARPDQFRYPALISAVAIFFAGGLYGKYVKQSRGHLLHLSACLKGKGTRFNSQRDDVSMQDLP